MACTVHTEGHNLCIIHNLYYGMPKQPTKTHILCMIQCRCDKHAHLSSRHHIHSEKAWIIQLTGRSKKELKYSTKILSLRYKCCRKRCIRIYKYVVYYRISALLRVYECLGRFHYGFPSLFKYTCIYESTKVDLGGLLSNSNKR